LLPEFPPFLDPYIFFNLPETWIHKSSQEKCFCVYPCGLQDEFREILVLLLLLPSYALLYPSLDEGYMKASDLMSVDIIAATENVSAIEVATRIVLGAINGMPIISKDDGKLLGVVTTIDILRAIRNGGDLTRIIAKEIMSPHPFSVMEDADSNEIIDIMDKNGIMMLPVVENDGRLIGVCSRSDVLKEILNERFVTIGMTRTVTRTIGESA
jgi:CBS domain-containing protein